MVYRARLGYGVTVKAACGWTEYWVPVWVQLENKHSDVLLLL